VEAYVVRERYWGEAKMTRDNEKERRRQVVQRVSDAGAEDGSGKWQEE
jgi:hypothetical protein